MPKIRALRAEIDRRGLDIDIQVDGGINHGDGREVVQAGANVLVAGYGVYRAPNHDYAGAIATLRAAAHVVAGAKRGCRYLRVGSRRSQTPHPDPLPQAGEGGRSPRGAVARFWRGR